MTAEIVQATRRERIEYRYRGPLHMIVVYEQGVRRDGVTFVEGLPRSNLRDLRKKLTFVPAGHEYHECQTCEPLSRMTYFYFDPAKMPVLSETGAVDLGPRLYFEDAALWDTALKLTKRDRERGCRQSALSRGARRCSGARTRAPRYRKDGCPAIRSRRARRLATADRHRVYRSTPGSADIARHARRIGSPELLPFLSRLQTVTRIPPHRYHTRCRIERAKALLAKPAPSVTDIGLALGFSQTSSFTAAFRRETGFTPTGYYRSLG